MTMLGPLFVDTPEGRVTFDPSLPREFREWMRDEELAKWRTERVTLADGQADQTLIPGVAAVPLQARQLDTLRAHREARRLHAPMPSGGLFDDVARAQQELF